MNVQTTEAWSHFSRRKIEIVRRLASLFGFFYWELLHSTLLYGRVFLRPCTRFTNYEGVISDVRVLLTFSFPRIAVLPVWQVLELSKLQYFHASSKMTIFFFQIVKSRRRKLTTPSTLYCVPYTNRETINLIFRRSQVHTREHECILRSSE